MNNVPEVKLGIVAVSRDCFPIELSKKRKAEVLKACAAKEIKIKNIPTVIEKETDALQAYEEITNLKVNALIVYLGNFGPEGPATLLAQKFNGPVMFVAAAEETGENLINGRGDAYCGMLNASYNLGLRKVKAYIPDYPVGTPDEVADMIKGFIPVARILVALKKLKIFAFGPRPQDFLACNAPIKPLYDIGVEVMENSELDLYDVFRSAEGNPKIKKVAAEMAQELGNGNAYPDLLAKLAQFEVGLMKFMGDNLGASQYGIFADKCWPSFEKYFGFVPCYVNSRLAAKGIPVACEVDIYGALSEYIATCATEHPATLLDINNTVPRDMYEKAGKKAAGYQNTDLFMGFHCGNTCSECLAGCSLKYQLIMHRLMEAGKDPNITRGTLEGRIRPGDVTLFRLQSTADASLKSYIADGEVLDVDPKSFGGIGIFAVKEMGRFYRHVLIEQRFPHHGAIAFKHSAKTLYDAMKMLGLCSCNIYYNQPKGVRYCGENPFN
ncbi:MAG TPA: fucose isomerase [Lentisphaeria bacterium]|nr:MAG: fucose isomerase [Lentisphaerae bacterium GWF2_50_93]HCE43402.1 fucose isomerase [Lentisphaeria bacterium]